MSRTRRIAAARDRRLAKWLRVNGGRVFMMQIKVGPPIPDWPPLFPFLDRPMFFDREGQPLDPVEYGALHQFRSYIQVAESQLGPLLVSTVWLGHDMGFGQSGPPLIFETMVFPADERYRFAEEDPNLHPELRAWVHACGRTSTAEEAERIHAEVCMDIRQTLAKIEMAERVHDDALEAING